MTQTNIPFAFFGSSHFSVIVLDELERAGFIPTCVVTTPDKPQGRKLIITPNPVKTWALQRNITVHTPEKLDTTFIETTSIAQHVVFIVASYGKIIPASIIELPSHKTLNIHPSLLPTYRGASPLQSAILDDAKHTGVTIMRIDEKMDHGPLIAQQEVVIPEWPTYEICEDMMARTGAQLLAQTLPAWVSGTIKEIEQDHSRATFTTKIKKEDALLTLSDDPYLNFRKIQAYHEWPQAYFIVNHHAKEIRVKVTSASFTNGTLVIEKVIPEGGKEMSYKDFQSGYVRE